MEQALSSTTEITSTLATAPDPELPILPRVAQRVITLASDPDAEIRDLADVIKHDAVLTGQLLRVANSPLYGSRSTIVSLAHALSRLGLVQLRQIALTLAMRSSVYRVAGFDDVIDRMFRDAAVSALFGQEIGRTLRTNVEEAFLAGLLHDVGAPVVLKLAANLVKHAPHGARGDATPIWAAVRDLHGRFGATVIEKWCLPASLAAVAREHHAERPTQTLTMITCLADALRECVLQRCTCEGDEHRPAVSDAVLDTLSLYPDQIAALLAKGRDLVATAFAL